MVLFWVLNVNVNGGLQKYGPTDTAVVATVMMMGTAVDVVVEDRCDGVGEMNRRWVAIGGIHHRGVVIRRRHRNTVYECVVFHIGLRNAT